MSDPTRSSGPPPRIVVFRSGGLPVRRLRRALPAGSESSIHESWSEFLKEAAGKSCPVGITGSTRLSRFVSRWQAWLRTRPDRPPVLAAPQRAKLARRLAKAGVRVAEILWTEKLEASLPDAVRSYRADPEWISTLGNALEEAAPHPLHEALLHALRARPPITSVSRLAREVDRHPATLRYHWRKVHPAEEDLTLKGFLEWIVTLRTLTRRESFDSWNSVADWADLHPRTLRRVVKRRVGRAPTALSPHDVSVLFHRFCDQWSVLP